MTATQSDQQERPEAMIRETITFNFDTPEQQKAFHERLNTPEPADDDAAAVQAARDRMTGIVQRAVLAERERCATIVDRLSRALGEPYIDRDPANNTPHRIAATHSMLAIVAADAIRSPVETNN